MVPSRSFSTIVLSAGRIVGGLLGLASVMVLSRLLSQEAYGTYRQVWLVYDIMLPFLMLGLPASVVYFLPQFDKRGQKMVVVQTASLLALAGLMLSAISYLFAKPLAGRLGGAALEDLLRLFFWFPVLSVPLLFVDSFLVATYRVRAAAWFNVFSSLVQFSSLIIPVVLGYDLRVAMYSLNIGALARFVAVSVYVLVEYKDVPFVGDAGFVLQQLRYSIPLGLSSILGTVTQQLDRVVIAWLFGAAQYAIYVNGATELPFIGIIAGSVMTVVTPEFVRLFQQDQNDEIIRLWHSATRKVALLFLPLTAFLMVFGMDAVTVLFSERYAESTPLFRIFLLLLPLRITTYGSLLMAAGKSSLILKAAGGTVIINVVLVLTLTPLLGLPGAAIATVLSVYAMGGWQLYKGAGLLGVTLRQIFPWGALGRIAMLSTLAAMVAWLVTVPMPGGVIRLGAGSLIFGLMAVPLLWRVGGARSELVDIVDSIARKVPFLRHA